MVINMTTISTDRNGIFCFTIFSSDCFDMPCATNKFMPSGGVRKPMHRLITSVFLRLRSSAQLSKIRRWRPDGVSKTDTVFSELWAKGFK